MRQFFFILLILLLYSNYFCAQETQPAKPFGKNPFSKQEKNIHFSYLWEHETLKPGIATTLAIVIDFDKGWHIQPPAQLIPADYFEKFIVPSTVKVKEISQNAIAQSAIFTPPFSEYSEEFKNNILFYKNKTIVYIPIHLGDNFKEEKLKVNVEIFYQMCNDKICLRGTSEFLTAEINVSPNLESKKIYENIFSQMPKEPIVLKSNGEPQKYGLILMILMACLGGVLLNFTPCVLPIIPIKIMGLSHAAGSRKKSIFLGLIMSAGIISFWLVLGLLISIIPGFTSISNYFKAPYLQFQLG